jgi:polar amino acid transport system substrate-binding protein
MFWKTAITAAISLACVSPMHPLLAAEPVPIVTGNDYEPFSGEELRNGGITTWIVKEALEQVGMDARIAFQPWKRGYQETLSNHFAATFPYVPTEERQRDMAYSDPILTIVMNIYSAPSATVDYRNTQSLAGHTLCSPIGFALPASIEALIASGDLKKVEPTRLPQCIDMILAGRADVLLCDEFTFAGAAPKAQTKGSTLRPVGVPVDTWTLHLIAAKSTTGTPPILEAFNRGLAKLKQSGRYDQIMKSTVQ